MSTKTLFLAWQDKSGEGRLWFPLGRLDIEPSLYRFRYSGGAVRAQQEVKFPPLWDFPQLLEDYKSLELFPLFRNRVIAQGRPDRADYLGNLDLQENADPFEMLSVSGGYRVTDDYEVFPKLVKADDGSFVCRFFLHGWRHTSLHAQERLNALKPGEELYIALELANPVTGLAVQLQTYGLPHDWLDPALYRFRDGEGNGRIARWRGVQLRQQFVRGACGEGQSPTLSDDTARFD